MKKTPRPIKYVEITDFTLHRGSIANEENSQTQQNVESTDFMLHLGSMATEAHSQTQQNVESTDFMLHLGSVATETHSQTQFNVEIKVIWGTTTKKYSTCPHADSIQNLLRLPPQISSHLASAMLRIHDSVP